MSGGVGTGLLMLLAAVGLVQAVYFTLLYYRVIPAGSGLVPAFCRMEERVCEAVVFTRYGRVFLVPNSLLGIFFYVLCLYVGLIRMGYRGGAEAPMATGHYPYEAYALVAAGLSVLFGIYLIHALVVRLKMPCPLCFAGHAINFAISALLLWMWLTGK